jgi:ABC-type sugar transport system ATPase subunit
MHHKAHRLIDELLQLADRLLVISNGRIVHQIAASTANRVKIGLYMAAGHWYQAQYWPNRVE